MDFNLLLPFQVKLVDRLEATEITLRLISRVSARKSDIRGTEQAQANHFARCKEEGTACRECQTRLRELAHMTQELCALEAQVAESMTEEN